MNLCQKCGKLVKSKCNLSSTLFEVNWQQFWILDRRTPVIDDLILENYLEAIEKVMFIYLIDSCSGYKNQNGKFVFAAGIGYTQ
jgi:hypothetical protein